MILAPVFGSAKNVAVMRSGLGSCGVVLPKKFSSSIAARPLCASELPISPNLYGFVPSRASSSRPFLKASRAYSAGSISGFFGTDRSRLPLSQISKSANSSLRDSAGCASPVPLVCVTSYSGSHRARVCT
jgi:hypothetical protein